MLAHAAAACRLAQALYQADVDASRRVAKAWHALDYQTRHAYVDRAVILLETPKVIPFTPRGHVSFPQQPAQVVARISEAAPWGEPA